MLKLLLINIEGEKGNQWIFQIKPTDATNVIVKLLLY